jgi:glycosyltransferase involved in cell wall biosynthesis
VKIQILLPAYNGERFLAEQLDSILAQQGDFTLHITVRDDGSTDSTRDILARYEAEHERAHGPGAFRVIHGRRVGVNASVMELVNSAPDADLYAFSDQDDLWYDFRLQEAVLAFRKRDMSRPLLWTCREELTDEALNTIALMPVPKHLGDLRNAVIQNKAPGHTQVFNRRLLELFRGTQGIYVYDWAMYLTAAALGEVFYCPRSCGKYRQHGENAIGYSAGGLSHLVRRARRLLRGEMRGIARQQEHFLARHAAALAPEDARTLSRFIHGRKSFSARLKYALTADVRRDSWLESLQFRVLYALGML